MPSETAVTVTVPCIFCEKWNRVDTARVADRPKCGECGRPILLDRPLKLTDETFSRVIASAGVPVLVDFYADWCGPCKAIAPIIDAIAHDRAGRILVGKVDTDRNPATASAFGIRSIPTLIVFNGGNEVARELGAVPRQRIDQLIDAAAGARA